MNQHTVIPFRKPLEAFRRDEIVDCMAGHLVAAILCGNLDTSSGCDVIQVLRETPERFNWRTIHDHMDDALAEAKQLLIAKEIAAAESDQ